MLHLVRRFFQSLSPRYPATSETASLRSLMTDSEFALWASMVAADQRHSLKVVERFRWRLSDASTAEIVGVALHDVGKVRSGLGTFGRVVATLVGPHTRRFATYHDHERVGLEMLRECGSTHEVLAILEGNARPEVLDAFRWADDC